MIVERSIKPCTYCGSKIKSYFLKNNDLGSYYNKEAVICLKCLKEAVSEIASIEQMKHLTKAKND